ncbi:MAG: preprotein translocase subunit SecY [Candidatus Campbellbacteria bacterium]|nr:preprotein translocase subunit SecY [Candidatus Campbellbacteria bacterium]
MNFFVTFQKAFKDPQIKKRIFFVLFALFIFRVLAAIPIPAIDQAELSTLLSGNQFLGLLNLFSGGGLSSLSIVMLGVGPFITASIGMQLLTTVIPQLKTMYHEEGDAGRRKFSQISRMITVPLALFQAFGFLIFLQQQGILSGLSIPELVTNAVIVATGSVLIMWVGELISEFGIGNGVSMIIFAGIVAGLPSTVQQLAFTYTPADLPIYIAFAFAAIAIVSGVVAISEAERPIPITNSKQARGGARSAGQISTYLPLKVNQAGVMPIIFALAILLFPQFVFGFLSGLDNAALASFGDQATQLFQNAIFYSLFYFGLVFFFTYFYTAITFDPESIAENLQKSGSYVPGVRPGTATEKYIGSVLTRITFVGATFLGVIAVLPLIMQGITGNPNLAIGGTALLIVVSVVLDFIKKVDAQVSMREY